jgi:hypothetical protein
MQAGVLKLIGGVTLATIVAVVFTAVPAGQAPADRKTAKPYTAPRTAWGDPDLQGNWDVSTLTPLERPDAAGGKLSMTMEEAARIEAAEKARVERAARASKGDREAPPVGNNVGGYNNFWIHRGDSSFMIDNQYRTSIIVDPPDGKVPALTAEATARAARGRALAPTSDAPESANPTGVGAYDNIEQRPLAERCIIAFGSTSGPPSLPNYFYNNLKQIIQTPDYVVILVEMVHDARIIPLNKPHGPSHIKKWFGDSVGRWDGDTLVVETTNFNNKTRFRGSTENLKVIERFTRVDPQTILYRFTVEDKATWPRPWTGEYPWVATNEHIYEYACHEGNYAMGDIMRGARLIENEEAEAAKQRLPGR